MNVYLADKARQHSLEYLYLVCGGDRCGGVVVFSFSNRSQGKDQERVFLENHCRVQQTDRQRGRVNLDVFV